MTDPYLDDPYWHRMYDMTSAEINGDRIVCVHGFPLDVKDHRDCDPWGTVDQWTAQLLGEDTDG